MNRLEARPLIFGQAQPQSHTALHKTIDIAIAACVVQCACDHIDTYTISESSILTNQANRRKSRND